MACYLNKPLALFTLTHTHMCVQRVVVERTCSFVGKDKYLLTCVNGKEIKIPFFCVSVCCHNICKGDSFLITAMGASSLSNNKKRR